VLVHTPHRDKAVGTRRSLDVLRESGVAPGRALIDHNNELTVEMVKESGCWLGFSIYPDTKMDPDRMVRVLQRYGTERMIVNSACDWGRADPLNVARTARAMEAAGFDADEIDRVVWRNPVEFFAQSGRLELDVPAVDPAGTFRGNTIRRGEPV
jgi:predicted metal-dependent TIM-barrel fold hydrolase